jgi:hypothetical protein
MYVAYLGGLAALTVSVHTATVQGSNPSILQYRSVEIVHKNKIAEYTENKKRTAHLIKKNIRVRGKYKIARAKYCN